MTTKVCMCFNDLALYRRAIYKMIDSEYYCDWYIEDVDTKVKEFDKSELKRVKYLHDIKIGPFYYIKGFMSLLFKDYDVYFVLGSTRNLLLFPFCLLKHIFYPKKKIYYWTHGFYGKESKMELFFWKRPLFKLADGLFTYGDYAKKIMVEDGFNENTIYPIHNSLDYDTQLSLRHEMTKSEIYSKHFKNNYPVLIFLGRLTKIKKLSYLIETVSILKKNGELYNVVLVGDGPEHEILEEKVRQNGMEEQVWFYGASYDEKVNAVLVYNADLCVAPGNIGLTAMHVMMFGCPAVSHNDFSRQMPEFEAIKPGTTGDYYKYGSVEDLAITISQWFSKNSRRREEVRQACYQEIDTNWNPYYQMDIISKNLK